MKDQSPCCSCVRCKDPHNCCNKNCEDWRTWFLAKWARIHAFGKEYLAKKPEENEDG